MTPIQAAIQVKTFLSANSTSLEKTAQISDASKWSGHRISCEGTSPSFGQNSKPRQALLYLSTNRNFFKVVEFLEEFSFFFHSNNQVGTGKYLGLLEQVHYIQVHGGQLPAGHALQLRDDEQLADVLQSGHLIHLRADQETHSLKNPSWRGKGSKKKWTMRLFLLWPKAKPQQKANQRQ